MATLRERFAKLVGFGQEYPAAPTYIWVKKDPKGPFLRASRHHDGLYKGKEPPFLLQKVLTNFLVGRHRDGKKEYFYQGTAYYFSSDPKEDPNGRLSELYMPEGELPRERALLRQVDAIGHVPKRSARRSTKSLLKKE